MNSLSAIFNALKPMQPYIAATIIFIFEQFASNAFNKYGPMLGENIKQSLCSIKDRRHKAQPIKQPYDIEIERWL
jgi:hypothetical protein